MDACIQGTGLWLRTEGIGRWQKEEAARDAIRWNGSTAQHIARLGSAKQKSEKEEL